jgi:hypothetical protein
VWPLGRVKLWLSSEEVPAIDTLDERLAEIVVLEACSVLSIRWEKSFHFKHHQQVFSIPRAIQRVPANCAPRLERGNMVNAALELQVC